MKLYDVVCQMSLEAEDPQDAARKAAHEALNNPRIVVLTGERDPMKPPMSNLTHIVRLSDLMVKELDRPIKTDSMPQPENGSAM